MKQALAVFKPIIVAKKNYLNSFLGMNINDAIVKRIKEICNQKGIKICSATLGGEKSPSAIYDLIKDRTK